jgi:hypothetical protein
MLSKIKRNSIITCEPIVPSGSWHIAEGDHPLDRLLQVGPGGREIHSFRL